MNKQKLWRTALTLGAAVAAAWLAVWLLGPVLLPFLLGLLPARGADKAVARLQKNAGLPRWLAAGVCVAFIYILLFLVVFLLGHVLLGELERFFRGLPQLASALVEPMRRLEDRLLSLAGRFPDGIGAALEQWTAEFFRSGAGLGSRLYDKVFSVASAVIAKAPDIALFSLTSVLSGFMLAAELPRLRQLWERKAPKAWKDRGQLAAQKLRGTLLCWLKAQGKLMLVTFLVLTAGFLVLGIEYPLLFSTLIALIDALPVLGSGIILIPWSLMQFVLGNTFRGVGLICLYGAAALIRTALEPRLLGKQMGLDPLLTLLALYAGYHFFGVLGMILFPMGAMFLKQILD